MGGQQGRTPNAPALIISAGVRFGVKCDQTGSNRSVPPASKESLSGLAAGEREVDPRAADGGTAAGNLRSSIWGILVCPFSSPAFWAGLVTAFNERGDFLAGSRWALVSRLRLDPKAAVLLLENRATSMYELNLPDALFRTRHAPVQVREHA